MSSSTYTQSSGVTAQNDALIKIGKKSSHRQQKHARKIYGDVPGPKSLKVDKDQVNALHVLYCDELATKASQILTTNGMAAGNAVKLPVSKQAPPPNPLATSFAKAAGCRTPPPAVMDTRIPSVPPDSSHTLVTLSNESSSSSNSWVSAAVTKPAVKKPWKSDSSDAFSPQTANKAPYSGSNNFTQVLNKKLWKSSILSSNQLPSSKRISHFGVLCCRLGPHPRKPTAKVATWMQESHTTYEAKGRAEEDQQPWVTIEGKKLREKAPETQQSLPAKSAKTCAPRSKAPTKPSTPTPPTLTNKKDFPELGSSTVAVLKKPTKRSVVMLTLPKLAASSFPDKVRPSEAATPMASPPSRSTTSKADSVDLPSDEPKVTNLPTENEGKVLQDTADAAAPSAQHTDIYTAVAAAPRKKKTRSQHERAKNEMAANAAVRKCLDDDAGTNQTKENKVTASSAPAQRDSSTVPLQSGSLGIVAVIFFRQSKVEASPVVDDIVSTPSISER